MAEPTERTPPAEPEDAVEADDEETPEPRPADPGTSATGAFEVIELEDGFGFNIKPKDTPLPIPEDQREIAHAIYETWGVLKLLREQKVFPPGDQSFDEFRRRLLEAAKVGLAANYAKTRIAAKAVDDIRDNIALRIGVTIKMKYLLDLGFFGLVGIAVGVALVLLGTYRVSGLAGYGWVIVGAMCGAWISVAATRRQVSFDELPFLHASRSEPAIRLMLVALLSVALALMLELEIMTLEFGAIDLKEFTTKIRIALLLGVVAGISEKALSARIVERARKVLTPGNS